MNKITLLFFLILLPANVLATIQAPDELTYKGETKPMLTNPLEQYFETHPRPEGVFNALCSAIWRGYIATWEIKENNLYLVNLKEGGCEANAPEIPLSKIFRNQQSPVKASWYSGVLKIPIRNGSIYEKELILTIENGVLINEELITNLLEK